MVKTSDKESKITTAINYIRNDATLNNNQKIKVENWVRNYMNGSEEDKKMMNEQLDKRERQREELSNRLNQRCLEHIDSLRRQIHHLYIVLTEHRKNSSYPVHDPDITNNYTELLQEYQQCCWYDGSQNRPDILKMFSDYSMWEWDIRLEIYGPNRF